MFAEYILTAESQAELNTEIRFIVASANVDKLALIRLEFGNGPDDLKRRRSNVTRVLRALKKDSVIQFFVTDDGFSEESTEAVFLINKYGEYINNREANSIYVKL